ncbi:AraC family transcriptional regulator [Maribacter antarcticus]|uniref:AraC family transcriptional regulator n=1 Tax=Maribacter antarcticus TaxID=505250 RepID=UPI00047E8DCC|nr:AraC family transcriptional regulator [Maribacter antarcticus]
MKIYPFQIPKPVAGALIVQENKELVFFDKLHQHEEIQISLLVKGQGKLIIGDSIHSYTTGDLIVIDGKIPHLFQSTSNDEVSHMISLFFTPNSFGSDFFTIPDLEQTASFFNKPNTGYRVSAKNLAARQIMKALPFADKFSRFISFLELLKRISEDKITMLTGFVHPKALNANEGKRLQEVLDYVMHNFERDIKLITVANLAFMTPNAFCRFFKQRTNKTFFQFLIELRIEHACQLLVSNKDLSILEIAEKSGFGSISNFNRKFKHIKKSTPTAYVRH